MARMLTAAQRRRLGDLEASIDENIRAFVAVGMALAEIKRDKLWMNGEHPTFHRYIKARFRIDERYAQFVMAAAQMAADHPEVKNEKQARALAKVKPEKRQEIIDIASQDGDLTAKKIDETAKARGARAHPYPEPNQGFGSKPEPEPDIPAPCHNAFEAAKIIKQAARDCDRIHREISGLGTGPGTRHIFIGQLHSLKLVKRHLMDAVPHAVCPTCGGYGQGKCSDCEGEGWVNRVQWRGLQPPEETHP